MNLLQITKITRNGRVSLGEKAMRQLNVSEGDHIQIFEDEGGRACIAKVVPPSQ